jgi:PTH1 family peptidyl-tRNA hydrolase
MDQTLIIGLGNPDPLLEETYHNVGVLAVQWIVAHAAKNDPGTTGGGATPKFRTHKGMFAYTKLGNRTFVRPLVFMNESGRAVKEAMRTFGANATNIAIIHDDSDLPVGEYKLSESGRSAGHKGIQSIMDHLGTDAFARIRIGIREPNETHRKKAGDFVLSPINTADKKSFEEVFKKIADLTTP